MPAGVPAPAVSEAGDVSYEDLIRAECVPVGAVGRGAAPTDELPMHPLHGYRRCDGRCLSPFRTARVLRLWP
jgi:hypothetical protein